MLGIGKTPAQALEQTRAKLAASEAELARLQQERNAALTELATENEVMVLDQKIDHAQRTMRIHADRMPLLQQKLRDERHQERVKRKAVAVKVFETKMFAKTAAAKRVDDAVVALKAAIEAYKAASRACVDAWQMDLFPAYLDGGTVLILLAPNTDKAEVRLPEPIFEREAKFAASLLESVKESPLPPVREYDDEAA
jgi:hypothetical protein